jgi:hypothetical protein
MPQSDTRRHSSPLRQHHTHVIHVSPLVNAATEGQAVGKIDEAHMYKNKARTCHIQELAISQPSMRADDLAMKLMVLRRRRREEAKAAGRRVDASVERVATFATGTPIANSIGELWVMQTFLRPDLLDEAGVANINAWAATFTTTVNTVEVNATGTSLRPVTRVGKFCNLSELLGISSVFTDVVTRDEVPMALPTLAGGQRRIVTMTPSQEVKDFITDLGWRASNLSTDRLDLDNILKVSNDGRNVSLDPRMANLPAPTESRAGKVADEVMRIHNATIDNIYTDDTGVPMPRRGGLQILFCDRGTPKVTASSTCTTPSAPNSWHAACPMRPSATSTRPRNPPTSCACSKTASAAKCRCWWAPRKRWAPVNVQNRATALHHVDVPWKPCDISAQSPRS